MSFRARVRSVVLHLMFALSGVGLVLPGTLLPLLARQWGLGDGRSGLLLFLFFIGTSLGAFCTRGSLGRMLGLATLLSAVTFAVLGSLRGLLVYPALLVCGFGLGVIMTAITLATSRRSSTARLRSLTRLNLVWALGACIGPSCLLRVSMLYGPAAAMRGFAALTLLTGASVTRQLWHEPVPASGAWRAWHHVRHLPAFFMLTLPLITGVEAGFGGWLSTYTLREHQAGSTVLTAVTALWAGLLASRALFSGRHADAVQSRRWVMPSLGLLAVAGLAVGLAEAAPAAVIASAFCTGFGIGPLYPYLLTRLLEANEAGNAGFLAASAGSSLLPLGIGVLSARFHSLRVGLSLPFAAMVVLSLALLQHSLAEKAVTFSRAE